MAIEMEKSGSHTEESDGLQAPFGADIGHDLRTPLNSILGYAELLSHGLYGPLNSEQQEAVRSIIGCGKQLLELIDDVLDLAKLQTDPTALAKYPRNENHGRA